MRGALILIGALLVVVGLLWPWLPRVPLGRLPGDIVIVRPGFRFYFPITTMVIISLAVTLLLHLFRR
jgi:hypothetical protein